MRFIIGGVVFGWFCLGPSCAPARADGGSLRLSGIHWCYQINVFTAPTPLRAGDVDISALVLDAASGDPMTEVQVTVRMAKSGRLALEYPATTEAATNKLFRAARFKLPEPGRWQLEVEIGGLAGPAVIGGEVEVAEPLPRWQAMWLWISWPAVAVAVFIIHQVSLPNRARRR